MKPSLSASALKVLALFTMLLDHMAYYLYLPEPLRWVGRLAAPIFLFFVVEGFGRTRNYKKYLLRVYAVAWVWGSPMPCCGNMPGVCGRMASPLPMASVLPSFCCW